MRIPKNLLVNQSKKKRPLKQLVLNMRILNLKSTNIHPYYHQIKELFFYFVLNISISLGVREWNDYLCLNLNQYLLHLSYWLTGEKMIP